MNVSIPVLLHLHDEAYWGKRKYSGEQDLVWGGDKKCKHVWGKEVETGDNRFRGEHAGTGGNANPSVLAGGKMLSAFCSLCGAWRGSLGLEPTPELYIQHIVEIFREVKRVLRKDGTCWINIGDSMGGSGKGQNADGSPGKSGKLQKSNKGTQLGGIPVSRFDKWNSDTPYSIQVSHQVKPAVIGIKPLDRVGIPEMLVLALRADGWYWRSTIIWHKPGVMPESVNGWRFEKHRVITKVLATHNRPKALQRDSAGGALGRLPYAEYQDCPGCPKCSPNDGLVLRKGSWRPTNDFEVVLMLTKTNSYYGDREAVAQGLTNGTMNRIRYAWRGLSNPDNPHYKELSNIKSFGERFAPLAGSNLRSVWSFNSPASPTFRNDGKRLEHFAAFPEALPERCIMASTSDYGVCAECGAPYARVVETSGGNYEERKEAGIGGPYNMKPELMKEAAKLGNLGSETKTLGWRRSCHCETNERVGALVLDCFVGTGTTLAVAKKLGRKSIGFDLSEDYCEMSRQRIERETARMI